MKAMILAAGLGTRLRPWTLEHPKALVPVRGIPMLERVLRRLEQSGYRDVTVNIHHFGEQIIDFIESREGDAAITISDERQKLLDTGGGLLQASRLLMREDDEPFLVHNVDILSDADLSQLMQWHKEERADITLLTSDRNSSRKLIFDAQGNLRGWRNVLTEEIRPAGLRPRDGMKERAFSGIYIIGKRGIDRLERYAARLGKEAFPIMDFFLAECGMAETESGEEPLRIISRNSADLRLIDIGKPSSLDQANSMLL